MTPEIEPPSIQHPNVIAVVGPTGSGKTALAIRIAEALGSEVISADSMQFYRGMGIGTGAPSAEELARAPHHFVGTIEPSESMSAGRFEAMARPVIVALNETGKIAVVAGGSGLYVRALIDGLFDGPPATEAVRDRLALRAENEGAEVLYAELSEVDPAYAGTIDPHDLRRIVRALEVFETTGRPFTELHAERPWSAGVFRARQVAIDWSRAELYERINARVDAMIEAGFTDEVRALVEQGFEEDLFRLRAVGYREVLGAIRGKHDMEFAVAQMKQQSRRYAKRQLTWFRADTRIEWIAPDALNGFVEEASALYG